MSNSLGLVDFGIRLVNSVLNFFNCPTGKGSFLGNSNYRRTVINPAHQIFFWLVKKTLGLVDARFSLPKWQAVKLTFFAPCKQCSMLLTFFIPGEKTKYFQGTKALHPDIVERVRDSAINIDRKRNG